MPRPHGKTADAVSPRLCANPPKQKPSIWTSTSCQTAPDMAKRLVPTPNTSQHLNPLPQHLTAPQHPFPTSPSLITSVFAPLYSSTLANHPHLSGNLSLTLPLCPSSPSLQIKSLLGPSLISSVSNTLALTSPAAVTYTTVIRYTHLLPSTCTTPPPGPVDAGLNVLNVKRCAVSPRQELVGVLRQFHDDLCPLPYPVWQPHEYVPERSQQPETPL